MAKQYRSDMLAAAHETAADLRDAGVIERSSMEAFDEVCLTPIEPPPVSSASGSMAKSIRAGRRSGR